MRHTYPDEYFIYLYVDKVSFFELYKTRAVGRELREREREREIEGWV